MMRLTFSFRFGQMDMSLFKRKNMKGEAEGPFAPEGSPARIEGRTALYEYLRNYPGFIDVRKIPTLRTYTTDDTNIAIAEWSASGTVIHWCTFVLASIVAGDSVDRSP
jgi:hypothetical protein